MENELRQKLKDAEDSERKYVRFPIYSLKTTVDVSFYHQKWIID